MRLYGFGYEDREVGVPVKSRKDGSKDWDLDDKEPAQWGVIARAEISRLSRADRSSIAGFFAGEKGNCLICFCIIRIQTKAQKRRLLHDRI